MIISSSVLFSSKRPIYVYHANNVRWYVQKRVLWTCCRFCSDWGSVLMVSSFQVHSDKLQLLVATFPFALLDPPARDWDDMTEVYEVTWLMQRVCPPWLQVRRTFTRSCPLSLKMLIMRLDVSVFSASRVTWLAWHIFKAWLIVREVYYIGVDVYGWSFASYYWCRFKFR